MLLQWLDVFKAGQSCTLHRSLLLRAFIPRCVTLWVSSARTHEETRLRAFSLKDTSAARFSFFFLYCHFSDIHTLQVRFDVAPLCAKHSPNYLDSFFFFLFLFFWSCIYQWPEGVRKVVHFLSGPAHSYLQFKPRPPPSADEYSGWGDYWGATCLLFFLQATPIQDFLLQLQQLERDHLMLWRSEVTYMHSWKTHLKKDQF